MAKFKKNNPDYFCIYATINANTEKETYNNRLKIIKHDNIEIEHHTGIEFLKYVLGNNVHEIIDYVKNIIDEYY